MTSLLITGADPMPLETASSMSPSAGASAPELNTASRFKRFMQNHWAVLVLMIVAVALRWALSMGGGQFYLPDERLYLRSLQLVEAAAKPDWDGIVAALLDPPLHHVGFRIVGALPAELQILGTEYIGSEKSQTFWMAALSLLLASVAAIGLVYAIALRAGAAKQEAFLAALFMAAATTMFYYSRHLVPYDSAMAILLLALWVGIKAEPTWRRSLGFGLLAGFGFLTYYGYWVLAGVVFVLHIVNGWPSWRRMAGRSLFAGLGAVTIPVLLTIANLGRKSEPFADHVEMVLDNQQKGFAVMDNYWLQFWEYLWQTEHLLLLVWITGVILAIWVAIKAPHPGEQSSDDAAPTMPGRSLTRLPWRNRGLTWTVAALLIYLTIALAASGWAPITFNAFGRQIRQIVPFLCLAAASGWWGWFTGHRWGRPIVPWVLTRLIVLIAAFNFAPPLNQVWPIDFLRQAEAEHGRLNRALTVVGPPFGPRFRTEESLRMLPPNKGKTRYILVNVDYLFNIEGLQPPPAGKVILRQPHPLQFLPYQYDGLNTPTRQLLRSGDISMLLIDTRRKK